MTEELKSKIEAFLQDIVPSDCGECAPVATQDVRALEGIIADLIRAKWEGDYKDRRNVTFRITDRSRFMDAYWEPMPHPPCSGEHSVEQMQQYVNAVTGNAIGAAEYLRQLPYVVKDFTEKKKDPRD